MTVYDGGRLVVSLLDGTDTECEIEQSQKRSRLGWFVITMTGFGCFPALFWMTVERIRVICGVGGVCSVFSISSGVRGWGGIDGTNSPTTISPLQTEKQRNLWGFCEQDMDDMDSPGQGRKEYKSFIGDDKR